ncbi:hypothetical protein ISS30_09610 [bacterium]|nr:hypothetical protein [FCB group bacterium]MBL7191941.1 hypothetical protein [bacterium]
MTRLKLLLCAEGVIRDAEINTISIYNIIEELNSPGFPLFLQKMYIFSLLERDPKDPSEIECKIKLINNENQLQEIDIKADFKDKKRHRFILRIDGLVLQSPGNLIAIVEKECEELGRYTIELKYTSEPKATIEEPSEKKLDKED